MREIGGDNQDREPTVGPREVEVSPEDASYVREELQRVPNLTGGLAEFGADLQEGASRTYFGNQINVSYSSDLDAMIAVSGEFADLMWRGDLEPAAPQPTGAANFQPKGNMGTDPVGFVNVERSNGELHATVGAVDPVVHTMRRVAL